MLVKTAPTWYLARGAQPNAGPDISQPLVCRHCRTAGSATWLETSEPPRPTHPHVCDRYLNTPIALQFAPPAPDGRTASDTVARCACQRHARGGSPLKERAGVKGFRPPQASPADQNGGSVRVPRDERRSREIPCLPSVWARPGR